MTLTNSSNKKLKILEIQLKATTKPAKDRGKWALLEEAYTMIVFFFFFKKKKNEMTVTKDAADPQFRTAGINN